MTSAPDPTPPHPRPERGAFISFEGVDGAGKSTQVAALAAGLRGAGQEVVTVREPGDTALGELARSLVLQQHRGGQIAPWAEALLFVAARAQLVEEVILPALGRGAMVVTDRYADSTLAYQGAGRDLDTELLLRLHAHACHDLWPDLTVLLDLPLEVARSRQRDARLPFDRIESDTEQFHAAVRSAFLRIAADHPQRVVVVEARRPAAVVAHDVWRTVAHGLRLPVAEAAPPRTV